MDAIELPLVTQLCSLVFNDGQCVTAEINSPARFADCRVSFTGAVDRLPFQFDTADSVLLRAYFQSFARQLRASFSEQLSRDWPNRDEMLAARQ